MARPKGSTSTPTKSKSNVKTVRFSIPQELQEQFANLIGHVKSHGFVSHEDLRQQFGAETFTKAHSVLFREARMFVESRKPYGPEGKETLGFELARHSKWNKEWMKAMPPEIAAVIGDPDEKKLKYKDYKMVEATLEFTTPSLGGIPDGPDRNQFVKDWQGNPIIPRYCVRGMLKNSLPVFGFERILAYRLFPELVEFDAKKMESFTLPVIDDRYSPPRGAGKKEYEAMPAGTRVKLNVMLPTSIITPEQWFSILPQIGRLFGLSHGRSAGFGEFRVIREGK